ncbi:MAG: hypothetical protein LUP95_05890 [Euryarchaeota archaeon]|nr:hypothetical protein [Euryarchaeota archaeon]
MRILKGKHATLKQVDEDLYLEARSQLHPEETDATINVYGILTAEDDVVIHGSIESSEAFFGNNCHVKGSVITGGIRTGVGFKAHHIKAGEGAEIGANAEIEKIDAVDDLTIGSRSHIRHAASERGAVVLGADVRVDVLEAAKGTRRS